MVSRFGELISHVVSREPEVESVPHLFRNKDGDPRGDTVSQLMSR